MREIILWVLDLVCGSEREEATGRETAPGGFLGEEGGLMSIRQTN